MPVSYPANFLRRMLDENEGSGKDQFLGNSDWLSEIWNAIQYNKSAICGLLEPVKARPDADLVRLWLIWILQNQITEKGLEPSGQF